VNEGALPLGLYVHMPWCVRKCPYCDFNSHALSREGLPEQAYVQALLDDLAFAARDVRDREIISVFFGGGTPSLFAPESIARVLARARNFFELGPFTEITLEANPGTVERGSFAGYRDAGINRVSLGAQSFDDGQLASLGRVHRHEETWRAVADLRAAGIRNFNLDLMYALPGQSLAAALQDIESALDAAPSHISHYQLTLEPGTAFARKPPELPDDELSYEMQLACQARLAARGYRHYEVSAYARDSTHCLHNLNYWQFGDYLGIGAGAHGKLTDPETGAVIRSARVRAPARYLAAASAAARIDELRVVNTEELPFEFFLNAMRLVDGFESRLFEARTGLRWPDIANQVEQAQQRRLLQALPDGRWRPSALGRRFLDDLQMIFLPATAGEKSTRGRSEASRSA
jgi:oxygen-independent coproporphyrinogen-3 oxidase